MSTREWAYNMIEELTEEDFNTLIGVLKVMHEHSKRIKKKSVRGAWSFAANPDLVPLEEGAWEKAAVEKHLQILEDMKNENP